MLERILIVLFILVITIFSSVYMLEEDYPKITSFNSSVSSIFDISSS